MSTSWNDAWTTSEVESLAAYARHLMSQDSKFSALKSLQGEIWQEGYSSGELRGQVFDDVPIALRRWREQGKKHLHLFFWQRPRPES